VALVNEVFRFYYIASTFASGLADVTVSILTPSNVLYGPFICTESARTGIYYYDYTPLVKGNYSFEADSVSVPNKVVQIKEVVAAASGGGTPIPFAEF
jgi:hypothetical protein